MKKKLMMLSQLFIFFIFLFSCQDAKTNVKSIALSDTKTILKTISKFSGNFSGIHNQKEIYITLIPETTSEKVNGFLMMDGKKAKIDVTEQNGICNGKITEDDTKKQYAIVIKFNKEKLNCSITFPEFNNQVLSFDLSKSKLPFGGNENSVSGENGNNYSNNKRNPEVVGKWRFTEVLSSGSGAFYASFSTDYFIKINADGTAVTWTGRSAGGTNTVTIEGGYGTNVKQYQCCTNGKKFHFVNLQTGQEELVNYYAEPSRMMFSYGSNKRVYQRIN